MTPLEQVDVVARDAERALDGARTISDLDTVEIEFLGRAKGKLTGLLRLIGTFPANEKRIYGQFVNDKKAEFESRFLAKKQQISAIERSAALRNDAVDVTLPGLQRPNGHVHPLSAQIESVKSALINMGYSFFDYPDVEHYHYNFETLNYPPDHPAFDEQMSFYVDSEHLLRTQTTAFQAHIMERTKPPIRAATVGKCYRYEAVDATHSHTFHQVDLLAIDEGLSMADLKGTFAYFVRQIFGDVEIRFRPDFFPFVEPGVEVAVRWGTGWLELGGAGMVHPNILEAQGIDSERYSGFAWGLGVDRMPMAKYGVNDIRAFSENDIRFLQQF